MSPLAGVLAAVGSTALYVAMAAAVGGEPWDSPVYGPVIAIAAGCAGFARPRAAIWIAVSGIAGQFLGWAVCAAIFEPPTLLYWPMVALLTIPLFVAPVTAGATALGAAAGWWRARRHTTGQRRRPRP